MIVTLRLADPHFPVRKNGYEIHYMAFETATSNCNWYRNLYGPRNDLSRGFFASVTGSFARFQKAVVLDLPAPWSWPQNLLVAKLPMRN
jgi:hypothetical protein